MCLICTREQTNSYQRIASFINNLLSSISAFNYAHCLKLLDNCGIENIARSVNICVVFEVIELLNQWRVNSCYYYHVLLFSPPLLGELLLSLSNVPQLSSWLIYIPWPFMLNYAPFHVPTIHCVPLYSCSYETVLRWLPSHLFSLS